MVPDSIEREVLIDAPEEVVWSIVTEPAHMGQWLSDSPRSICGRTVSWC